MSTISQPTPVDTLAPPELTRILERHARKLHPPEFCGRILRVVAAEYKLAPDTLWQGGRPEPLAWARQLGMFLSYELTTATMAQVATVFGRKDHTSVIHAAQLVTDRFSTDNWGTEAIRLARIMAKLQAVEPSDRLQKRLQHLRREVRVLEMVMGLP